VTAAARSSLRSIAAVSCGDETSSIVSIGLVTPASALDTLFDYSLIECIRSLDYCFQQGDSLRQIATRVESRDGLLSEVITPSYKGPSPRLDCEEELCIFCQWEVAVPPIIINESHGRSDRFDSSAERHFTTAPSTA
jgi:hypothetical protein